MRMKAAYEVAIPGFGSGNPKPEYNFITDKTETSYGRAHLILKRTGSEAVNQSQSFSGCAGRDGSKREAGCPDWMRRPGCDNHPPARTTPGNPRNRRKRLCNPGRKLPAVPRRLSGKSSGNPLILFRSAYDIVKHSDIQLDNLCAVKCSCVFLPAGRQKRFLCLLSAPCHPV